MVKQPIIRKQHLLCMKNKVSRHWLFLLVLPFLQACPPFICNSDPVVYPSLSDSILNFNPYNDGDTIVFVHSQGAHIDAYCSRVRSEKYDGCAECCVQNVREEDVTELKLNYPLSDIRIKLFNHQEGEGEMEFSFASGYIYFPVYYQELMKDSLMLENKFYHDVYVIPFYNSSRNDPNGFSIFADTLYYSVQKGIIKISMSNNEYFILYEE